MMDIITKNTGVIIQARMGSSRLPHKMSKVLFDEKTLLEHILSKLQYLRPSAKLIVATTDKVSDDYIENISLKYGYSVYRGSENNVLNRFIESAQYYDVENIIRVCADNPFIQEKYFTVLLDSIDGKFPGYTGFRLNGKIPAIKSHFGFFPELVSLEASKKIDKLIVADLYREHVTNFFYDSPENNIPVRWIDVQMPQKYLDKVRLTIDTEGDINIARKIVQYQQKFNLIGTERDIFFILDRYPELMNEMKNNIAKNEK